MSYASLSPAVRDQIHGAGPTVRVRIEWLAPIEHHVERDPVTDRVLIHGWAPPAGIMLDGERVSTAAPFEGEVLRSNLASFAKAFVAKDPDDEIQLIRHAVRMTRKRFIDEVAHTLDPSGKRTEELASRLSSAPFADWPAEARHATVRATTTFARVFVAEHGRSPRFVRSITELGEGARRVAPEEADRERIVQALSGQNPNAAIDRLADLVAQLVAEKTAPAKGGK